MLKFSVAHFALALVLFNPAAASARLPLKPADFPERFRDFKIYTTSRPDPASPARILATAELRNEGKRDFKVRAFLQPNKNAGFRGSKVAHTLRPGQAAQWSFGLLPPEGFKREVLRGEVWFGRTRARGLYLLVQGADPPNFDENGVQRITARAEVVATFAPSVPIDWWRTHPSATLESSRRLKPLLTLAERGQSRYSIVFEGLPRAADGSVVTLDTWDKAPNLKLAEKPLILAISDLQRCLRLMSGATLPVVRDAVTPAVRLQLNDGSKWAYRDSFHLFTTAAGDVIIESGAFDGLRQGIYTLLTDYLDCHWFFPGQMGEEIPQPVDQTARIGQIDREFSPSFYSSTGMSVSAYPDWDQRNRSRINEGRMVFGHSWNAYLSATPELLAKHPDWWARDRQGKVRYVEQGSSATNFCSTNPEVIEMVAKKLNENPDDSDRLVFSLDPNDYAPMCQCDRCLALDKSYGVENADGTFVSDRMLHFSQEIYSRLEPNHRDKFLGILVYGYQMEVPKSAKPHAHHTGVICNMEWVYDHTRPFNDPTSPANREFFRQLQGWGKILPQFGFYDYYTHWRQFAPWGLVHKMREDLPAFRDLGGTYLFIEAQSLFSVYGLNNYIAGRLAWDVDADVDVLLEELYAKYYGPAAKPMRAYWMTAERWDALLRSGSKPLLRLAVDPQYWVELDCHLKEAERAVASAPQRFRDRVAYHRMGFDLGRRQVELIHRQGYFAASLDNDTMFHRLHDYQAWISQIRKKYPSADGYYPTIIGDYFFTVIDKNIAAAEAKAKPPAAGHVSPA